MDGNRENVPTEVAGTLPGQRTSSGRSLRRGGSPAASIRPAREPAVRYKEVASSVGKVFLNTPPPERRWKSSFRSFGKSTNSASSWGIDSDLFDGNFDPNTVCDGPDDLLSGEMSTLMSEANQVSTIAEPLAARAPPGRQSVGRRSSLSQGRRASQIASQQTERVENLQQTLDALRVRYRAAREAANRERHGLEDAELEALQIRRRAEKHNRKAEASQVRTDALENRIRTVSAELDSLPEGEQNDFGRKALRGASQAPVLPGAIMTSLREVMHAKTTGSSLFGRGLNEAASAARSAPNLHAGALPSHTGPSTSVGGGRLGDENVSTSSPNLRMAGMSIQSHKSAVPVHEETAEEREKKILHNQFRETIREELIEKANSARGAFRSIDLNGSGVISLQEFADGVKRLGVDWQTITGLKKEREFFNLFAKKGVITFRELFPHQKDQEEQRRLSTPEFWQYYCKTTSGTDHPEMQRCARWLPTDRDEELSIMLEAVDYKDTADFDKKKMSGMWKRLKARGKSDARVREIVALHLPRGTGLPDMDGVKTFSENELKECKKVYSDKVNEPVRNIQKEFYAMREKRKELSIARQRLYQTTGAAADRAALAEEMSGIVAGFGQLKLGLGGSAADTNAEGAAATPEKQTEQAAGARERRQSLATSFGNVISQN